MKSAMHPEAREEFLAAIDYYNEAEPGLGMAFYSEVEAAIGLIENPSVLLHCIDITNLV